MSFNHWSKSNYRPHRDRSKDRSYTFPKNECNNESNGYGNNYYMNSASYPQYPPPYQPSYPPPWQFTNDIPYNSMYQYGGFNSFDTNASHSFQANQHFRNSWDDKLESPKCGEFQRNSSENSSDRPRTKLKYDDRSSQSVSHDYSNSSSSQPQKDAATMASSLQKNAQDDNDKHTVANAKDSEALVETKLQSKQADDATSTLAKKLSQKTSQIFDDVLGESGNVSGNDIAIDNLNTIADVPTDSELPKHGSSEKNRYEPQVLEIRRLVTIGERDNIKEMKKDYKQEKKLNLKENGRMWDREKSRKIERMRENEKTWRRENSYERDRERDREKARDRNKEDQMSFRKKSEIEKLYENEKMKDARISSEKNKTAEREKMGGKEKIGSEKARENFISKWNASVYKSKEELTFGASKYVNQVSTKSNSCETVFDKQTQSSKSENRENEQDCLLKSNNIVKSGNELANSSISVNSDIFCSKLASTPNSNVVKKRIAHSMKIHDSESLKNKDVIQAPLSKFPRPETAQNKSEQSSMSTISKVQTSNQKEQPPKSTDFKTDPKTQSINSKAAPIKLAISSKMNASDTSQSSLSKLSDFSREKHVQLSESAECRNDNQTIKLSLSTKKDVSNTLQNKAPPSLSDLSDFCREKRAQMSESAELQSNNKTVKLSLSSKKDVSDTSQNKEAQSTFAKLSDISKEKPGQVSELVESRINTKTVKLSLSSKKDVSNTPQQSLPKLSDVSRGKGAQLSELVDSRMNNKTGNSLRADNSVNSQQRHILAPKPLGLKNPQSKSSQSKGLSENNLGQSSKSKEPDNIQHPHKDSSNSKDPVPTKHAKLAKSSNPADTTSVSADPLKKNSLNNLRKPSEIQATVTEKLDGKKRVTTSTNVSTNNNSATVSSSSSIHSSNSDKSSSVHCFPLSPKSKALSKADLLKLISSPRSRKDQLQVEKILKSYSEMKRIRSVSVSSDTQQSQIDLANVDLQALTSDVPEDLASIIDTVLQSEATTGESSMVVISDCEEEHSPRQAGQQQSVQISSQIHDLPMQSSASSIVIVPDQINVISDYSEASERTNIHSNLESSAENVTASWIVDNSNVVSSRIHQQNAAVDAIRTRLKETDDAISQINAAIADLVMKLSEKKQLKQSLLAEERRLENANSKDPQDSCSISGDSPSCHSQSESTAAEEPMYLPDSYNSYAMDENVINIEPIEDSDNPVIRIEPLYEGGVEPQYYDAGFHLTDHNDQVRPITIAPCNDFSDSDNDLESCSASDNVNVLSRDGNQVGAVVTQCDVSNTDSTACSSDAAGENIHPLQHASTTDPRHMTYVGTFNTARLQPSILQQLAENMKNYAPSANGYVQNLDKKEQVSSVASIAEINVSNLDLSSNDVPELSDLPRTLTTSNSQIKSNLNARRDPGLVTLVPPKLSSKKKLGSAKSKVSSETILPKSQNFERKNLPATLNDSQRQPLVKKAKTSKAEKRSSPRLSETSPRSLETENSNEKKKLKKKKTITKAANECNEDRVSNKRKADRVLDEIEGDRLLNGNQQQLNRKRKNSSPEADNSKKRKLTRDSRRLKMKSIRMNNTDCELNQLHSQSVTCILLGCSDQIVSASHSGSIIRSSPDATSQFSFTKQKSGVTGMILVSKSGAGKPDFLYSFGPDKHLTIHDYSSGEMIKNYSFIRNFCSDCICTDGEIVYVALDDCILERISVKTMDRLENFEYSNGGRITALTASKDSNGRRLLFVAFQVGPISVLDAASNTTIHRLTGHTSPPRYIVAIQDRTVASSSGNQTLLLHDIKTGILERSIDLGVPIVALSSNLKFDLFVVATQREDIICIDVKDEFRYLLNLKRQQSVITTLAASDDGIWYGRSNGMVGCIRVNMNLHWQCEFLDCNRRFWLRRDLEHHMLVGQHHRIEGEVVVPPTCTWNNCRYFIAKKPNKRNKHIFHHTKEIKQTNTPIAPIVVPIAASNDVIEID